MVHLLIHLCRELVYGGPTHLCSMWPIERYLCKLKAYVRNRSKPEGSIVEGYLAEECLTFCSRFLGGNVGSKITKSARFESCPEKTEYHIAKKQVKRQFVTAHQLQQQQKNKKVRQLDSLKPPQGGTRKSPRLNKLKQVSDATVSQKPTTSRRKLDLKNPPHADETMGENDPEGSEVRYVP
ncbi:hypothetical protein POM88_005926 [Heracleum sosnowskyi]|uniref:DUF4218 domain-containing protein n=1 Tax=Heracleum sosnowskyi TaxID=360622 RepID=A0AAD8N607_9APIA|nr:hypothetical protein POM88_005926 [Heracleum sosnowskyi]